MHHRVGDWVVQTEWQFALVPDANELDHQAPLPLDSVIVDSKRRDIMVEEVYEFCNDIVCPWTIQH